MVDLNYTREELKVLIMESNLLNISLKRTDIKKQNLTPILKAEIEKSTIGCRVERFSERIFWILNDIYDYPICVECGTQWKPKYYGLSTQSFNKNKFCSNKCTANNVEVKQKKIDTYLELTGFEYPAQNPAVIEKQRENYFEKTGYYHHMQNPEVVSEIQQYNFEKTGCYDPLNSKASHEKRVLTLIERTSFGNPMQNSETVKKAQDTLFERTGFKYALQNPESFQKSQKIRYKTLILPSNKEIKFQGYENVAILELIKTFSEEDLELVGENIPTIWYAMDGKKRRYYPDIYISSKNLIIEVKSTWTYNQHYERNQLKRQACIDLGYEFEFWICSNTKVLEVI